MGFSIPRSFNNCPSIFVISQKFMENNDRLHVTNSGFSRLNPIFVKAAILTYLPLTFPTIISS